MSEKNKELVNPFTIGTGEITEEDRQRVEERLKSQLFVNAKIVKEDDKSSGKKDPEEREYLLLYIGEDEDKEEDKTFIICKGRTNIYNHIKNMIEYIDPYESKVLVDGTPLEDRITVYEFMTYAQQIFNDGFAIEDYFEPSEEEDEKE